MDWIETNVGGHEATKRFLWFKVHFRIVNMCTGRYEYWYVFRNGKLVYDARCSENAIKVFIEYHPFAGEYT